MEQALEELQVSTEELQITDEELREANNNLEAAYQTLARNRQMYADLFEQAPAGYVVTDKEGIIIEANAASGAMLLTWHGHGSYRAELFGGLSSAAGSRDT
jgi:PAS domain-containing protein